MRYLLMICHDADFGPERHAALHADTVAWVEEMTRRGVRLTGNRLRPAAEATTVRVRDDQLLLTDGPFAEIKEEMAGFDMLECADLDEAVDVASKHPMARHGMVELRALWTD